MQPLVPMFGGTTPMKPFLPVSFALMEKRPFGVLLMIRLFTGPWLSPLASLYLNAEPDFVQKGFPVLVVPCGSLKDWLDPCVPFAMISRMAPPALPASVGFPTRVSLLPISLAEPLMKR